MKFFFHFLLFSALTFSQTVQYEIIFTKNYQELPFPVRIASSGIYAVEDFLVDNGRIDFSVYNSGTVYSFGLLDNSLSTLPAGSNPCFRKEGTETGNSYFSKECFSGSNSAFTDMGGLLKNKNGEEIFLHAVDRSNLHLVIDIKNYKADLRFSFPDNLASSDFIGIDKNRNIFLLIEFFLSDIPLKIKREVWSVDENGSILSRLAVPDIKYLSISREFRIDIDGNLYHLLSEENVLKIFKWNNLTQYNKNIISYPQEYNYSLHYNNIIPVDEFAAGGTEETGLAINRATALRIADTYVMQKYNCTANNLAPSPVTAPGGDLVQTPSWLIAGFNARVPYKWGGFNTIADFSTGILNNKFAGDIHTDGVSSAAVGVDCSGFVSRCWQRSSHASTSYMPNITTVLSSWDALKPGDGILKSGHVRLFVQKNPNGSLRVVEAAARNWDVSYWSFSLSDLTAYNPVVYNTMESNYSFQRPVLTSSLSSDTSKIVLKWRCDTTDVKGYRLYRSSNFLVWNLVANEDVIKDTSFEYIMNEDAAFFRVSSVLNSSLTESHWSNVLAVSNYSSARKILIVDGFERETGSWQGPGHPFVFRYGKALVQDQYRFESILRDEISQINLTDYFAIVWFTGDQSTVEETFSNLEQASLISYLEAGGNLFANGSEIGWDLYNKGTASDKLFFNHYLKAAYINDNANSKIVTGEAGSFLASETFNFGQTYTVGYPDEISINGGSSVAFRYSNNKIAGVHYSGTFGTSSIPGKVIYFAFPLETTASDASFNSVMRKVMEYFLIPMAQKDSPADANSFELNQNYPNPFNPSTLIKFSLPSGTLAPVTLRIFDLLGNEVATLINEEMVPGNYEIEFNAAKLASGVYYYILQAGSFSLTKKMLLLK
ncbi:MAG: T9SS type A sorting domain-containing protein [Ignavibacteriaceae bacterium]